MSPSWRETLSVVIGAHEVRVVRCARGFRPQETARAEVTFAARSQPEALDALARALAAVPGSAAPADVVVSDEWVRFALLNDTAALRGLDEYKAAAAHTLERVYGEAARDWRVTFGAVGKGTLLVAGMDLALFDAIGAVLAAGGAELSTMTPLFALALNHCRDELQQPAWFVAAETGRAVLCFTDGGALRVLRSHRIDADLAAELPVWLEQSRLLDGVADEGAHVVVASSGARAVDPQRLPFAVRQVDLNFAAAAFAAPALAAGI